MTITPHQIGGDVPLLGSCASYHENRPRAFQGVRHGHEVVLPANTADHLTRFHTIGAGCTGQGHYHGRVHEAGVPALERREPLVPVELVRIADPGHTKLASLGVVHVSKIR